MSRIDWPVGFDRTPPAERTRNNRYEATLRESIDDLERELERVGVDDWRLSTAAEHQKMNPNYPYADASPDDPSAVVRWTMDNEEFAVACDAYSRLRDNVRTLFLYIKEKRKMEQRPVATGESEFANARLPPAEGDEVVVASQPPHVVLGVDQDATDREIKAAFREKVLQAHPDQGGDGDRVQELKEARQTLIDSRTGTEEINE